MRVVARDLFTLNAQYFEDLFYVRAISLAGYVILMCEFVDAIPDEVRYIWPTTWSTVKIIYLTNRYGNLAFLAAANLQLLGVWRSDSRLFCYESTMALSLIQFASFASIHVLVLLRAWATWGRHVKILALLSSLFVVYAAVCIAIITWAIIYVGYDAYPFSFVVGTCIGFIPQSSWILWIPGLVLECAVFILTMASVRQFNLHLHFSRQPPIIRVICRDGIMWFIVTLFSSLFNIFVWAYYSDRPLNMLANTFTLCLTTCAGQRLVLDLRKAGDGDALSTTRVGRAVERAIEALPRSLSHSPVVFAARPSVSDGALSAAVAASSSARSPRRDRSAGPGARAHGAAMEMAVLGESGGEVSGRTSSVFW